MKKPVRLKEKDIVKVVITDTKAFTILSKDLNNPKNYSTSYDYYKYALDPGDCFCERCSAILKSEEELRIHNEHCKEEERKWYKCNEMVDFVYDSLEDGLIVEITTRDGKEYRFQLKERVE